jgi:hypothetical protein
VTDQTPSASPVSHNPFHAAEQPAPSAEATEPNGKIRPALPAPMVFSHDPERLAAQGRAAQAPGKA